MVDGPLSSLQSRTLRWLLIICLTGVASGVLVPIVFGLLLPASVYEELPDSALFFAVVAGAVGLSAAVHRWSRRKSPPPGR